jgi:hypothetical protein
MYLLGNTPPQTNLAVELYYSSIRWLEVACNGNNEDYFYESIKHVEDTIRSLIALGAYELSGDLKERCEYLRSKPFLEIRMERFLEEDEKKAKRRPKEDIKSLAKRVNDHFKQVSFCQV